MGVLGPFPVECGVWLTLRNMLLYHLCYYAKFSDSRWNHTVVIHGDPPEKFGPSHHTLHGHWNQHRLIGYLGVPGFLVIMDLSHTISKINDDFSRTLQISPTHVFNALRWESSLRNFVTAVVLKKIRVMLLPHKGKGSSLDIAPLTILDSGALQPRKWQLIGTGCSTTAQASGCSEPTLTDYWVHSMLHAASRHTMPQSTMLGLHPVIHVPNYMDHYSFTDPPRDGWLSWSCWLTDSGWLNHKVVTHPASSLAQDRESSPAETSILTTLLCCQLMVDNRWWKESDMWIRLHTIPECDGQLDRYAITISCSACISMLMCNKKRFQQEDEQTLKQTSHSMTFSSTAANISVYNQNATKPYVCNIPNLCHYTS